MTTSFAGFELVGSDDDETRLLVHRAAGYATAIPGHPRAAVASTPAPNLNVTLNVTMTDKAIELDYRLDTLPSTLPAEPLAISLALAYGTQRAVETPDVAAQRKLLPVGAHGCATTTYRPRGGDEPILESLTVTIKTTSAGSFALYQTIRFRRGELTPVQWANVRTAIACSQTWDARPVPTSAPQVWPPSELAARSVTLDLSPDAWAEAQAKAAAIGPLTEEDVQGLIEILLTFANNDDPPTFAQHPYLLELASRQVAMRGPAVATDVLLRNISAIKTTHDLRAWCWQCIWAIGNRSEISRR